MTDDFVHGPITEVEDFNGPVKPWTAADLDGYLITLKFVALRLDGIVTDAELSLTEYCDALLRIREAKRLVADLEQLVENRLGDALGGKMQILDGVGRVKPHRRKDRKSWDKEALLRDVLDSRLVNTATGEVLDETPLDRVLSVWNLGAPRVTVLRDRGLKADDYCTTEWRDGYTVEIEG